jgi:hypothetical protein
LIDVSAVRQTSCAGQTSALMAKRWQNNAGILRGVPDVLLAAHLDGPFTFWRD